MNLTKRPYWDKYKNSIIIILCSLLFLIISCMDDDQSDSVSPPGSKVEIMHINSSFGHNFPLTLDLGKNSADVYFIFTNTSLNNSIDAPKFISTGNSHTAIASSIIEEKENEEQLNIEVDQQTYERGTPYITEFNSNPDKFINVDNNIQTSKNLRRSKPRLDIINGTEKFTNYSGDQVTATCRKIIKQKTAFGMKTLIIYVANNCWYTTGSKKYKINQEMVDALGNKFLKKGLKNDIYDWTTSIFGEEWGPTSKYYYINPDNEITILLTDIGEDNSTDSGIAGYFYGVHNYKDSSSLPDKSNERVMFFIDSVFFAKKDGTTWDITDSSPQETISTLAHEFQHMIHYYQKTVTRNVNPESWLNEMCSMVTEDLLANKIQSHGPRGVEYKNPSAGNDKIFHGRLPRYNYFNDISTAYWPRDFNNTSNYYSINYALGSYLARNYGGANFFKDIVQSRYSGHLAIEYALEKAGIEDDYGTILQKWAASNLVSDQVMDNSYKYNNKNKWFKDSMGFSLGSINLFNYSYAGKVGPKIYTNQVTTPMPFASNRYYAAGKNLTGKKSWNIQMDDGEMCRLTVVKKYKK